MRAARDACLHVWEEGVEAVCLQFFPFQRVGTNRCSLTLFKNQWKSSLALIFLPFHLTFKLYLLGKPGISKSEWFGHARKPKPQCDMHCAEAWAGIGAGRSAACNHCSLPAEVLGCCRIRWRLAWAFFPKSALVLLCSSQDRKGRNKLWSCYYYFSILAGNTRSLEREAHLVTF